MHAPTRPAETQRPAKGALAPWTSPTNAAATLIPAEPSRKLRGGVATQTSDGPAAARRATPQSAIAAPKMITNG
jgi:hypothetical protein